jgi:hypothetical protein
MIESEQEYRRCKTALERLLFPDRKLSAEEDAMAKLLLHLIGGNQETAAASFANNRVDFLRQLVGDDDMCSFGHGGEDYWQVGRRSAHLTYYVT